MNEKKKRISFRSILNVLLCAILIPIILINLVLILRGYLHPEELPGIFGIKPAVVLSGSMEPTIKIGDLILVHSVDSASLKKGDVVCYLYSGKAVTHRILEITQDAEGRIQYVTQGDANNVRDDQAVRPEQIQGIYKGERFSGLGQAILFMQSTQGMVLFILCPLFLFLIWDLWRRRQLDQAEAKRTAKLEAELAALKAEKETAAKDQP